MVKLDNGMYIDGWLQKNLDAAKALVKNDFDMVIVGDGPEGCLSGDSIIQVSRGKLSKKYPLKYLYNQYNNNFENIINKKNYWNLNIPSYIRAYNGKDIRLHKLKAVHYSGKKEVFLLKLENDKQIKATASHKFLTKDGWKRLDYLKPNEEIMCDTLHPKESNRKRIKLYDIMLPVDYHPYITDKCKRIEVHRLIYEARLNGMLFLDFLDILLNEKEKAKTLKYVDPKIYHVHHLDGNHYNNSDDNLVLIKKKDHLKYHGINSYANFSQGTPIFSKIISIKSLGIEQTYDIECEEPYHNFVANGIIVHNSGKSVLMMQVAHYLDDSFCLDRVCFTAEEFMKAVKNAKKHQAILFDEAFRGLSSRQALSPLMEALIKMFAEIRQKNLFIIVVMPCFFELTKYIAMWRSRALVHVYLRNGKRGNFAFYGPRNKNNLYIYGKKDYNYKRAYPSFRGRFIKHYVIDEVAYRKKKFKAFQKSIGESIELEEGKKNYMRMYKKQYARAVAAQKKLDNMKAEIAELKKANKTKKE